MTASVSPHSRRTHRKACRLAVDYSLGGRFFAGLAKDISLEVVFIENQHPDKIGEPIQLTLASPDLPKPLKLDGVIARTTAEGIGVRFNKHHATRNEMLEVLVDRIKGGWM
jgi:Tfp pilus assembly protein PilZ